MLGWIPHTNLSVKVHFSINCSGYQIKQRNNVARKVFELFIELLVILPDVIAIDFQNCFLEFFKFLKLFKVKGWSHELLVILVVIVIVVIHLNKCVDERLKLLLGFIGTNICSPNHLSVLADFLIHSLVKHTS